MIELYSLPNSSEIEQSALSYSDLNIKNLRAVRHLGFDRKRILTTGAVLGRQNTSSEQRNSQYGRR